MDIGAVLGIFVVSPFLALIPAVAFGFLFAQCSRLVILVAALAWFTYFPYEQSMKARTLCSGECNIRVDLLFLYPLLALVSALAVYADVRFIYSKARR